MIHSLQQLPIVLNLIDTTMNFRSLLLLIGLLPAVAAFSAETGKTTVASTAGRIFVGTPSKSILRSVGDCMTPRKQMQVLHPLSSCDEAISLLLNKGISGAPVLDDDGKLLGMISSSDFLFKDYSGAVIDMEGSQEALESCVEVVNKIVGTKVEDLMTRKVATINSNESMAKAADQMARNNLHRLLVLDPKDDAKLVGILTRSDVMRDVMTTVRAALPERGTHDEAEDDGVVKP